MPELEVTQDAVLRGQVAFRQPRRGYRVNVDSILLAAFAVAGGRIGTTLDLGAGVGALSLLVHHLKGGRSFVLVERDAPLLALAKLNLRDARVDATYFAHDLERGLPAILRASADLVVSNPPYFDARSARTRSVGGASRVGIIEPFVQAAARALKGPRARAAFVYPARDLTRLLTCAQGAGLVPKRLRLVHANEQSSARVALVELRRARPGGLDILPPLFEWIARGKRSAELQQLLGEE
ncbi:MAG TPA: methyltransferase [Polyangiaceae bacterium]|jgi:tRNA1Val (adenine37-N6)-methyltransferase